MAEEIPNILNFLSLNFEDDALREDFNDYLWGEIEYELENQNQTLPEHLSPNEQLEWVIENTPENYIRSKVEADMLSVIYNSVRSPDWLEPYETNEIEHNYKSLSGKSDVELELLKTGHLEEKAMEAFEKQQRQQLEASQLQIDEAMLPEGAGWERSTIDPELYDKLKQGNGLALFTRPAEEGFGYEVQAVMLINQGDVDAYREFSDAQVAAASSLSDSEKPYTLLMDADTVARYAANAEGAGYMIKLSGDVLGQELDVEQLHKELGEHLAPLLGENVAFEMMLRVADKALSQDEHEVTAPSASPVTTQEPEQRSR